MPTDRTAVEGMTVHLVAADGRTCVPAVIREVDDRGVILDVEDGRRRYVREANPPPGVRIGLTWHLPERCR